MLGENGILTLKSLFLNVVRHLKSNHSMDSKNSRKTVYTMRMDYLIFLEFMECLEFQDFHRQSQITNRK